VADLHVVGDKQAGDKSAAVIQANFAWRPPSPASQGAEGSSPATLVPRAEPSSSSDWSAPAPIAPLGLHEPTPVVSFISGEGEKTETAESAARAAGEVLAEIDRLRQEHRDLDGAIAALTSFGAGDQIQVQRLKKRKLLLRDRISHLEDQVTPDIIA
jgi:hypothetical protein